jgi:hypothetical protein
LLISSCATLRQYLLKSAKRSNLPSGTLSSPRSSAIVNSSLCLYSRPIRVRSFHKGTAHISTRNNTSPAS